MHHLTLNGLPCRLAACLLLGALLWPSPSTALEPEPIAPDHQRPVLSPQEEQAWLQALVVASPHRLALEEARALRPEGPAGAQAVDAEAHYGTVTGALGGAQAKKPGRQVFGYLPYWTKATAIIPWSTMTTVAWFSVGLSTGGVSNSSGWNTKESQALIAKAHSHGVQVVLCFTQFGTAAISAILATPASRQKAVNDIIGAVLAGGGDGANIDFEGLAKADKDKMSAFVTALNDGMKAALPGGDVTLATPCVDWSGAWDYDVLAEHSDGLFVMAYGIHWGGGPPGPQLPMASKPPWSTKTLQWVIDDYITWGKAKNKAKFILGLPLYGNTWASATAQPGSKATGSGKSITYSAAQTAATKAGGWKWDAASESSWFVVKDAAGVWQQTWCDNLQAFGMRVDYLGQSGVNLGLWALGYSNGDPAVLGAVGAWQQEGSGGPGGADAGGGGKDAGGTTADAGSGAGGKDAGTGDAGTGDAGTADSGTGDAGKGDAKADTVDPDTAAGDLAASDSSPADSAGGDAPADTAEDTAEDAAGSSGDVPAATDAGAPGGEVEETDTDHLGGNAGNGPQDAALSSLDGVPAEGGAAGRAQRSAPTSGGCGASTVDPGASAVDHGALAGGAAGLIVAVALRRRRRAQAEHLNRKGIAAPGR